MNLGNTFSSRLVVGAAIVGIVGAAGVYIYEQLYAEKKRAMLVNEVARLDKQVATMKQELEAIRELQKQAHIRRLEQKKARQKRQMQSRAVPSGDTVDAPEQSYASDSEYLTDYHSLAGTDAEMDSEEFYDVHTDDDEDNTLRDDVRNGHLSPATSIDEDLSEKTAATAPVASNKTNKVEQ